MTDGRCRARKLLTTNKPPHCLFNWSLPRGASDLPFQIPPDRTLAEEVSLVLSNPLSLSDNSFAANTEFFFFNLRSPITPNSTSSSSHSSSGLLTMSDQQPQSHTMHPRFVPAQWPDQSDLPQVQSPYISPPSPFVVPTPHPSFVPPAAPSVMPPTMSHVPPFQYNRTMPSPGNRSAPRFDGHSPSLKHFFDEMDYLGNACGLSPTEKIQHTLCYLDFQEYET